MLEQQKAIDYRTQIEKDGVIAQLTRGFSMMPMLRQNRDTVIIKRITEKPKENDVLLYLNDEDKYVLHRVIKVLDNGYIIRGDNNFFNEYNIRDENIVGILEGFYRDEKFIDCSKNAGYKLYIQLNRRTYYLRMAYSKFRSVLSKIKHKIFK